MVRIGLQIARELSTLNAHAYLFCRHPDLAAEEIEAIEDMFDEARQKGWLK